MTAPRIADLVRDVPDFPSPGIVFKDITPVLADPVAFHDAIEAMMEPFRDDGVEKIAGIEARGFVFAAPIGLRMGAGVVPVRKPGKLPCATVEQTYDLEYGTDTVEMHADAIKPGERVLIVDDVLATGGTAAATAALLTGVGAEVVGVSVLLELSFLGGRQRLDGHTVHSVVVDDGG